MRLGSLIQKLFVHRSSLKQIQYTNHLNDSNEHR